MFLVRGRESRAVIPLEVVMAKELSEVIRENAEGPAEVVGDSGSMKQHPLKDQVEADRYLSSKRASRASGLGVRVSKLVPPGAE